jgi:thymidine kinase
MAKLYFRYGTVGSAKTLNLLAVAHNYTAQGKKPFLVKPAIDVRFGELSLRSRAGLEKTADLVVAPDSVLRAEDFAGVDCTLVDEAQFLSASVVDQLRGLTGQLDMPVICYGLRTDFRSNLFEGARRLLEVADSIEEIKTTCAYCRRKAILNLKLLGGVPTLAGPQIDLGAEEKYLPACWTCWEERVGSGGKS